MRKIRVRGFFMIAFFTAFMFGPGVFAENELRVDNIESELTGSPDSSGYVDFAVRARVWNLGQYGREFNITVEGINSSGSPLKQVYLRGRIGAREEGTLEGRGSMPLNTYESIQRWQQVGGQGQ